MNTTAKGGHSRFENDATRYAEYLETPDGRLRADLSFANLEEFLPPESPQLRALDLGCGTGAAAIRLARRGMHVTLVDSSSSMLELAKQAVIDAGLADRVEIRIGEASEVESILRGQNFDMVLCHNVLEYVEDEHALLRGVAKVMRDSRSVLSLLVRSQAGEVLKSALLQGDLEEAKKNLAADWGTESLYGGKVRFYTMEALDQLIASASMKVIARRGVRVMSDYLPAKISRTAEYERVLALESELGRRQEFTGMARYLQYFVRCEECGPEHRA